MAAEDLNIFKFSQEPSHLTPFPTAAALGWVLKWDGGFSVPVFKEHSGLIDECPCGEHRANMRAQEK